MEDPTIKQLSSYAFLLSFKRGKVTLSKTYAKVSGIHIYF